MPLERGDDICYARHLNICDILQGSDPCRILERIRCSYRKRRLLLKDGQRMVSERFIFTNRTKPNGRRTVLEALANIRQFLLRYTHIECLNDVNHVK